MRRKRIAICSLNRSHFDKKTMKELLVMECRIPVIESCYLLLKNAENNHDAVIELVFDHNDILMRAGLYFIGDSPEILFKKLKHRAIRSPIMKTSKVDQVLDLISSFLSNVEANKEFDCDSNRYLIQLDKNGKKEIIYVFGNVNVDKLFEEGLSFSKELEALSVKIYADLVNKKYAGVIAWSYPYKR